MHRRSKAKERVTLSTMERFKRAIASSGIAESDARDLSRVIDEIGKEIAARSARSAGRRE